MFANSDNFLFEAYLNRQAGRIIWHRFKVNSKELELLAGLCTYLVLNDKKACSVAVYFGWSRSGLSMQKKEHGYLRGLISKGLLHVVGYRMQPGRFNSVAISSYGAQVLDMFFAEAEKIRAKHADRFDKLGYRDISFHSSEVKDKMPLYVLSMAGRDD